MKNNSHLMRLLIAAIALATRTYCVDVLGLEKIASPLQSLANDTGVLEKSLDDGLLYRRRFTFDLKFPTYIEGVKLLSGKLPTTGKVEIRISAVLNPSSNEYKVVSDFQLENREKMFFKAKAITRYVHFVITSTALLDDEYHLLVITRESVVKPLPKTDDIIIREFNDRTYTQFNPKSIRRIVVKKKRFSKDNKIRVLVNSTAAKAPEYFSAMLTAVKGSKAFEAVFPREISTYSIDLGDYDNVRSNHFYVDTESVKLGQSDEKHVFKREKPFLVLKLKLLTAPEEEAKIKRIVYYDQLDDRKVIYTMTKDLELEFVIRAKSLFVLAGPSLTQRVPFEVYTSPCHEKICLNDGVCVLNPDLPEGFGCKCSRAFLGPQCEKDATPACILRDGHGAEFIHQSFYAGDVVQYTCRRKTAKKLKSKKSVLAKADVDVDEALDAQRPIVCKENGALYDTDLLETVLPEDLCPREDLSVPGKEDLE